MIVAIVRFPLPDGMTADQVTASFEGSAPSYQGLPGLHRKYYLRAEDGSVEAVYDEAWRARLTERFGAEPQVEYLECPVIVDPEQIIVT
jgi:hypothetical protein